MGFGSFTLGYLLGQSFQNPQDIIETPGKCQADYDNDNDPELRAYGEECYWKAWDKAYKEGTINELKNVQTAGIQTAKVLGTTKERLISAIESGEIKIVSIIEPNVVAEIPTKMIWTDASREEAQRDEYKQYLNEVMDLIGKYQHRVIP